MSEQEQDSRERLKELEKKKKRLIRTIARNKKSAAKARAAKKRVLSEIRSINGKYSAFNGMTDKQAEKVVKKDLDNVKPVDVYPTDLEREFDKLERKQGHRPDRDVVQLEEGDLEEDYSEEGVLDLSET